MNVMNGGVCQKRMSSILIERHKTLLMSSGLVEAPGTYYTGTPDPLGGISNSIPRSFWSKKESKVRMHPYPYVPTNKNIVQKCAENNN